MKKRSERLGIVVDLAYQEECDRAKHLERIIQELRAAERQLADLSEYYTAYAEQNGDEVGGHSATLLQSRRHFLQHLHHAIEQQHEKVHNIKAQVDTARGQWISSHTKTENLKEYVGHCATRESEEAAKREQKAVDEWSTQRFNRKPD